MSSRLPGLELETDAARELAVRPFGLGKISCSVEALPCLEQVRGQVGPRDVNAEALDQAASRDDRAAGLPEGTPLARARLGRALCSESKRALSRIGLAHDSSVVLRRPPDIGPLADPGAEYY
jgi:hypothetical protein